MIQASGAPSWIRDGGKNAEDLAKYLADYKEAEGVELDWDMIERNEAMRSLAKLGLNSFWVSCCMSKNNINVSKPIYCRASSVRGTSSPRRSTSLSRPSTSR